MDFHNNNPTKQNFCKMQNISDTVEYKSVTKYVTCFGLV